MLKQSRTLYYDGVGGSLRESLEQASVLEKNCIRLKLVASLSSAWHQGSKTARYCRLGLS